MSQTIEGRRAKHQAAHAGRRRSRRGLVEWVAILVLAVLATYGIKTFLIEAYVVPTPSMYPTIMDNDRVLVDKISYSLHRVHTGDIVVFHESPADTTPDTPILIKRVIGLPGQTLRSGPRGEIFVDGRLLHQPWLTAEDRASPGPGICATGYNQTDCDGATLHLPAGEYYVMGDNRGNSDDSRYWGPITRGSIIGHAFARIWPLDRLHWW